MGVNYADTKAQIQAWGTQQRAEAVRLRTEAARITATPGRTWTGYKAKENTEKEAWQKRAKVADLEVRAQRFEERATIAEKGMLAYRKQDVEDYRKANDRDFQTLRSAAIAAKLVVYSEPLGADTTDGPDISSTVRSTL
jgi:hypothetical protein